MAYTPTDCFRWHAPPLTDNLAMLAALCCPVQAENVLALVNARTAAAADSALAGLQGGLGQLVSELRRDVLSIITELEARLDFDEDLPPLDVKELKQDIAGVCKGAGGLCSWEGGQCVLCVLAAASRGLPEAAAAVHLHKRPVLCSH